MKQVKMIYIMKRACIYIIVGMLAACSMPLSKNDIQFAETTLQHTDSLENTITIYTDTAALGRALYLFAIQEDTKKTAKTQYHLGNAYKHYGEDSLAFACYTEAADLFLSVSDSVYYPLSILEMSLIAERQYKQNGNATMLDAIRTLQREMIHNEAVNGRRRGVLWCLLAAAVLAGGAGILYLLLFRKPSRVSAVSREDLERNIELVVSQGGVKTTLHWQDYGQFCRTTNAYLYNAAGVLQSIEPHLTEQDVRFLVLVLLNLSAKEIADIMNLSQNSISNKKTRTAQKLGTIAADLRETIIGLILKTDEQ